MEDSRNGVCFYLVATSSSNDYAKFGSQTSGSHQPASGPDCSCLRWQIDATGSLLNGQAVYTLRNQYNMKYLGIYDGSFWDYAWLSNIPAEFVMH